MRLKDFLDLLPQADPNGPDPRTAAYRPIHPVLVLLFSPFIFAVAAVVVAPRLLLPPILWLTWFPLGKDVLLIDTRSVDFHPEWRRYLDERWLPALGSRAKRLGPASSASKQGLLERWALRTYGRRAPGPVIAVLRPFRRTRVFCFGPALVAFANGDFEPLRQLEADARSYLALDKDS